VNVCWWEHAELLEHFGRREDIWEQNAENADLWLRTREGEALLAVHFVAPPDPESLFRQYAATVYPVTLSQEEADRYFVDLLRHWTSYGHRMQTEYFMREELKLPADTAALCAIALESYEWQDNPPGDPENTISPTDQGLPGLRPDVRPPTFETDDPLEIGTYTLRDGGWVRLRMHGGMMKVELSIPNADSGGYDHPLSGFVRPRFTPLVDAAAALAGRGRWIITPAAPEETEQVSMAEAAWKSSEPIGAAAMELARREQHDV
jgi:hypothetical protein